MSSAGLNKWIVSGNLAADAQIKTVVLRNGESAQVATATMYVRKIRNREDSFTVSLSIWEKSAAWRKLPYLKKGSLIICTGSVEPNPYMSSNGNVPKAGLGMTVLDVDLDRVRDGDETEEQVPSEVNEDGEAIALASGEEEKEQSQGSASSQKRRSKATV